MKRVVLSQLLALVGAIAGGVIGYFAFGWLVSRGFYGLAIPGALLGLGCGWLAQDRSRTRGLVCAIAALALSIFIEGKFFPFIDEDGRPRGLGYMVAHLHELSPVTLLMMAIATVVAFWTGQDAGIQLLPREVPGRSENDRPKESDG